MFFGKTGRKLRKRKACDTGIGIQYKRKTKGVPGTIVQGNQWITGKRTHKAALAD